jgi:hypothetical protein
MFGSVVSSEKMDLTKLPSRHGRVTSGRDYTACGGKFRLLCSHVSNLPVFEKSITLTIEFNARIACKALLVPVAIASGAVGAVAARAAALIERGYKGRVDHMQYAPGRRGHRIRAACRGSSSTAPTSKTHKPALRHFMLRSAGRSLGPAARPRLTTATRKRLGEFMPRRALLLQAGPLAIPLRQAEMRIRDKTSVDKAPRAIYSSLTIDDHSLHRFGRT